MTKRLSDESRGTTLKLEKSVLDFRGQLETDLLLEQLIPHPNAVG